MRKVLTHQMCGYPQNFHICAKVVQKSVICKANLAPKNVQLDGLPKKKVINTHII